MNPHCWWILVRTVPHGTGTCVCLRCRGLGWRACNGRRFLLGVLHGYLGRVFGWSESRSSSMFYILEPCPSRSVGVLLGPAYVGFSTMGRGGPPRFSGSSDLSFIYCHRTTSVKDTLSAKTAFENFSETHGVKVKH